MKKKTKMRSKKNARKTKRIRGGAANESAPKRGRTGHNSKSQSVFVDPEFQRAMNQHRSGNPEITPVGEEMENSKVPDVPVSVKLAELNRKFNTQYRPENDFKRTIFQKKLHDTDCFVDGDMWRDDEGFHLTPARERFNELKRRYITLSSTAEGRRLKEYADLMNIYSISLERLNNELNKPYEGPGQGHKRKNITLYDFLLS